MICMTRVDNRLLHGQIACAWVKHLGVDCILIANDDLADDQLRKAMIRLAKPEGAKLVCKTVDDSAKAIMAGSTDKYRLLVIVESVDDALRLSAQCPAIRELNLGNAESREGARPLDKTFYATKRDEEALRDLVGKGVHVFLQRVPDVEALEYSC